MLKGEIVAMASLVIGISSVPQVGRAQYVVPKRKFSVASIRRNQDGAGGSIVRTLEGLSAHDAEFSRLIEMAFQTRTLDLSRVPDSLRSAHFDIAAKAGRKISGDEYWEMLRSLLQERFRLRFHYEAKEMPFYALIFAKKGAELGAKISRSRVADCPANPNGSDFCGVRSRPGQMVGQRVPLPRIARELARFAGRPIQDQTKLTGSFDFDLTWTPDEYVSTDGHPKVLNGQPIDTSFPSFFSAIQEELGLKLQSRRGPVPILIIDHAESPSEN